ncbi:hypothetical protein SAMN02745216_01158 [Desulfatibacillum alkenivorans DSM 16219]|uniref:Uncharacterized protein n=2 Tax=Desulfatibacillum alkenivorans TaxID=259354 RepID=A0A1M6H9S7_9BACT|nr:hypothetical protein SAMN02745216_01158 [Desulfatibacillum alkenivorans DSM 16219]
MAAGLISITCAAIMAYFSLSRLTYPGFKSWTAGFVLAGLGMILMSLRQQAPDWISIIAANSCIMAFPVLIFYGLGEFKQFPKRLWAPGLILAAGAGILTYYTYWHPNVLMRIVAVSLILCLLLLLCLALLLRRGGLEYECSNNLLKAVFAFQIVWNFFRAIITPLWEPDITSFFSAGAIQGMSFMIYILYCVLTMSGLIALNAQRMELDLASAGENIKELTRLIPICARCKKIRDDQGYWEVVESYIEKMTNKGLTHSICPECAKKLYPDLKIYDDDEDEEKPKS